MLRLCLLSAALVACAPALERAVPATPLELSATHATAEPRGGVAAHTTGIVRPKPRLARLAPPSGPGSGARRITGGDEPIAPELLVSAH